MEASSQWAEGKFENPQPLWNDGWTTLKAALGASPHGSPDAALPVVPVRPERFATPPASGVRVTWLGHSTLLLELDGHTVLTDPVWGERASPVGWAGPRRWYAPLLSLAEVPKVDAVLLSHDHYDHLDQPTIAAIASWPTRFIAPLGVGAHLEAWGVPAEKITELDWWEKTQVGGLQIVATPARHASGRALIDQNATLWASYALLGAEHRVFFSGDTGLFPALEEIGARYGPFDLTMIEVGAYGAGWPDWHLGPEQAVRAHQMLKGKVLLPIHWGLFNLAFHGWTEPIERVRVAAAAAFVTLVAPRPGQSVDPVAPEEVTPWWPDLPWRTAAQAPIVSTRMGDAGTP
jgi:L-ascorbate metabolism protein UlaG (beta-lactamase superfamily)